MGDRLVWERDGRDWPHRDASRFVDAGGLRWHVQRFDARRADSVTPAPAILLIHGTGASTHSWRGLAPLLAQHFSVVSVDLPGHGFTQMPAGGTSSPQLSLPGMARALGALLNALAVTPTMLVGHSAGAAIAARMCLEGWASPKAVVSLNGALLPLGGLAGQFFLPAAKLMVAAPFIPRLFSWRASDPTVLQRLIDGTGSTLDADGVALYGRLVSSPGHAAGVLGMMANWDLDALARDLPRLSTPLSLVVGANDLTVPPEQAGRVLALLRAGARMPVITLPRLGHLAHEERPDLIAEIVLERFSRGDGAEAGLSQPG